jgi:hypothetical protein
MDTRTDRTEVAENKTTKAVQDAFKPFAKHVYDIEQEIDSRSGTLEDIGKQNKAAKILQYGHVLAGMASMDVGNKTVMGGIKFTLRNAGLSRPTSKRLAENCRKAIYGNRQIEGLKKWLSDGKHNGEEVVGWLRKERDIKTEAEFSAEVNPPKDPVARLIASAKKLDEDELGELKHQLAPLFEANT